MALLCARRVAGLRPIWAAAAASGQPHLPMSSVAPAPSSSMSPAMKHYFDRRRQQDQFMASEAEAFELGRKHLARMMDMDEANMSQEDVDKAIEYLFPSGLDEKTARPVMKPPNEIFPPQAAPSFDQSGRPHSPFFFTTLPNFHQLLFDVVAKLDQCYLLNDRLIGQGKFPDPQRQLAGGVMADSRWMKKEELESRLLESLKDQHYEDFVEAIERLTFQPFSYHFRDFIFEYRVKMAMAATKTAMSEPLRADDGRLYSEAIGQRKTSMAHVRVTKPGTGVLRITHIDYPDRISDITYFKGLKERHQLLFPLQLTKMLDQVDVDVIVDAGGCSGQAGAARFALANALKAFVDKETVEEMNIMGLLTQNIRTKERKMFGRRTARSKYAWRKR